MILSILLSLRLWGYTAICEILHNQIEETLIIVNNLFVSRQISKYLIIYFLIIKFMFTLLFYNLIALLFLDNAENRILETFVKQMSKRNVNMNLKKILIIDYTLLSQMAACILSFTIILSQMSK